MNRLMKTDKVEASHEAYRQQRAQEKYDGKVEKTFPLKEFRNCTDYLTSILEKASFDAEDLGDIVRVALSNRGKATGV